jgi:uncharacterized protein (DUF3820 family)
VNEVLQPDAEFLLELANTRMPFGKYADQLLIDLPETYLIWILRQNFLKGKLRELLQNTYEIKLNGLEHLLQPLRY